MSKVKEHFTSRYEDAGVIIEADFAQLEVVVFAFLTQDPTLIDDIVSGKDIHRQIGAQVFNCLPEEVTKEQRQQIKPGTFLCIYGGGANKFAREHKVDIEFAKNFIEAFYTRYPVAKLWQENLVRKVEGTRYLIDEYTDKGHQKHEGYYVNVSGRKLYYKTNDTPEFLYSKGILTGFNPPDIKNYPVQSLATADIVLGFLGQLWRKCLNHRDKFVLINTVHDSVLLDCRKQYVKIACNLLENEIQLLKDNIKMWWKIDFNLPIKIEIKVGDSWGNLKEVHNE